MKILYITNSLSSHGGLERILVNKANLLAEKFDYEVQFLLPATNRAPIYELYKTIKLNYLPPFTFKATFKGIIALLSHIKRTRKKIKKLNPDIIIVANKTIEFYFLPFMHSEVKKVREIHMSFYVDEMIAENSFFRKFKNNFELWITKKYDKIVVLNKDEKKHVEYGNVEVIPNFIIPGKSTSLLVNKRAIAVGRLTPIKGFDVLLHVWAIVERRHPDWHLDIYGQNWDGTLETLTSLKDSLGVNNVSFCGPTDDPQHELHKSSMLLSSSVSEAFSMVILEAKDAGVVVISYDSPYGPRNIINDTEDGFVVPYGNVTKFADKICVIIENEELRKVMGSNAKKNSFKFSEENVLKQWHALFTNLIKQ